MKLGLFAVALFIGSLIGLSMLPSAEAIRIANGLTPHSHGIDFSTVSHAALAK